MFIRIIFALLFAVLSVNAQAQFRPLSERAAPKQELRVKHPNGISKVTVYLGSIPPTKGHPSHLSPDKGPPFAN